MKIHTFLVAGMLGFVMLFAGGLVVEAQDAVETEVTVETETYSDVAAELKEKVSRLRALHADLKAQVEAGEITAEEARAEWKEAIMTVRAHKQEKMEARAVKIQDRIEILKEKNPERAAELEARVEEAEARRADRAEKRADIRAQVEAGDLTKEEAREIRKEHVQEVRAEVKVRKAERVERRAEIKADRKPIRAERDQ